MAIKMKTLLGVCALTAATCVSAQDFPSHAITMVVPFAAGGPTDTVARNLGVAMTNSLKQQLIVENVGGAGGTIGVTKVAKSKNDGYTVLLHHIGMATAPALYRKLPYDTLNDFEYIGLVADVPMTMLGKKTLPPNNLKELIAYIKVNADKLNYANAGLGAASHLCGLLFMSQLGANMQTVSYKGTAPAMTDLLGGQVDLMCDQTTNTTAQIKAGTVKAYGVTTLQRVASLKELPTLAEQGMPKFEVVVWHGLYAPKGTPKPVLDKLVAAVQDAVKDATFKSRMSDLGADPATPAKATPEALRTLLTAEINKWGPVIKAAGQYAD